MAVRTISRRNLGLANGVAAGLMLAASRILLDGEDDLHVGSLSGADAVQALMIVGIMTAHSFSEGVGLGVSYGDGDALGVFITVAIAIHNIPEGLAISLVLIPHGVSVWKAGGWGIFSSVPQPMMALPTFLFVQAFEPFLPVGFGFAAGAMLWMVGRELIPDALDDAEPVPVAVVVVLATLAMLAFQYALKRR